MNILHSLILGLVEGLTEFIPVSSTFHLITVSRLLGLEQSDFIKLFQVVIQSGAILSIAWLYKDKIRLNKPLQKNLAYSFIPTAIVGALLYKFIKDYFFENTILQLSVFGGVGILFVALEWYINRTNRLLTRTLGDITPGSAVMIGLIQVLSVIPGVSRSGSILFGMIALGYKRATAAEYAFMLSLPTILAATTLDLYQNITLLQALELNQAFYLLLGTFSAFISALWVMKWLISYLGTHTLAIFGYYRLLVVALLYYLL